MKMKKKDQPWLSMTTQDAKRYGTMLYGDNLVEYAKPYKYCTWNKSMMGNWTKRILWLVANSA